MMLRHFEPSGADSAVVFGFADPSIRSDAPPPPSTAVPQVDASGQRYAELIRSRATPEQLAALRQIGEAGFERNQEKNLTPFDSDNSEKHWAAVNALAELTGVDPLVISFYNPSIGYTGTDEYFVYESNNPYLVEGTILHDLTTTADILLNEYADATGTDSLVSGEESFNQKFYNNEDKVTSAVVMFLDAMEKSVENFLFPADNSIADFLGMPDEVFLAKVGAGTLDLSATVTRLGNTTSLLAYKLRQFYNDDEAYLTAVVADSFAKTVGGYLGDTFVFDAYGAGVHITQADFANRLFDDFKSVVFGNAKDAMAASIGSWIYDGENPITSYLTLSAGSAISNVIIQNTLGNALEYLEYDSSVITNFIDFPPNGTDLSLSFSWGDVSSFGGEIIRTLEGSFTSFLSSQVFSWIDSQWGDVNLNNEGAVVGSVLGNFLYPGIGSLIGQVVFGFVFDLLDPDKHPHTYHSVGFDADIGEFTVSFMSRGDGADTAISQGLAEAAYGALTIATIVMGGEVRSVSPVTYGYSDDKYVWDIGFGQQKYSDAEQMLGSAVMAQLRSMEMDGGDPIIRALLLADGYNPSLGQFYSDLDVIREFSWYSLDPQLYGRSIINIADSEARQFLIESWESVSNRSDQLNLRDLVGSVSGEFIIARSSEYNSFATSGDDLVFFNNESNGYTQKTIHGLGGNDELVVDIRGRTDDLYYGNIIDVTGGDGFDRYIGDFSSHVASDDAGVSSQGVHQTVSENGFFYREDGIWTQGYSHQIVLWGELVLRVAEVEAINIVGTDYLDALVLDFEGDKLDGAGGFDVIGIRLAEAQSRVQVDLTKSGNQILYGTSELRGFEGISNVVTGSGDDFLSIDHRTMEPLVLGYGTSIDLGDGDDTLKLDVSGFDFAAFAAAINVEDRGQGFIFGIEYDGVREFFGEGGGGYGYYFSSVETVDFVGSSRNDFAAMRSSLDQIDGGAGADSLAMRLAASSSDIIVDLTNSFGQVISGDADIRNFEYVATVETGSGNDRFVINTIMYDQPQIWIWGWSPNTIKAGSGFDTLEIDFAHQRNDLGGTKASQVTMYHNDTFDFSEFQIFSDGGGPKFTAHSIEAFHLTGTDGNDSLLGRDASDTLVGGLGNDTLKGFAGDDVFIDDLGADHFDGGEGLDLVSFENAMQAIFAEINNGDIAIADADDVFIGFEGIAGSNFDDTLFGDSSANVLIGNSGNDLLVGDGGADINAILMSLGL